MFTQHDDCIIHSVYTYSPNSVVFETQTSLGNIDKYIFVPETGRYYDYDHFTKILFANYCINDTDEKSLLPWQHTNSIVDDFNEYFQEFSSSSDILQAALMLRDHSYSELPGLIKG